jgi:hypothetical protein
LYAPNLRPLALLFGIVSLAISLLSLVGLAGLGRAELFVAFLAQIVLPVVIGTFAMAVSSVIYDEAVAGRTIAVREAFDRIRPLNRDVLVSGLFASMIAIWAVIVLAQFGFVLMPLFFGPPILIQVIALERLTLRPARTRAREILKGQTARVIVYLLVIALGIGLLGTAALSAFLAIADRGGSDLLLAGVFSVVQIVVAAFMLPFLAASSYVCYSAVVELEEPSPAEA